MPPGALADAAPAATPSATPLRRLRVAPTGVERPFADHEIIVSKTDLAGRIRYANDVFLRVSDFTRRELIGAPHSVIRHPDMPRAVFHLLWEGLQDGREVFAYVLNLARNGDHYWVLAHLTPTRDRAGRIAGYHSNRRTVDRRLLPTIEGLYAGLRAAEQAIESGGGSKAQAIAASRALLDRHLQSRGLSYDAYVWSL